MWYVHFRLTRLELKNGGSLPSSTKRMNAQSFGLPMNVLTRNGLMPNRDMVHTSMLEPIAEGNRLVHYLKLAPGT